MQYVLLHEVVELQKGYVVNMNASLLLLITQLV